jgi:hypothetical protein
MTVSAGGLGLAGGVCWFRSGRIGPHRAPAPFPGRGTGGEGGAWPPARPSRIWPCGAGRGVDVGGHGCGSRRSTSSTARCRRCWISATAARTCCWSGSGPGRTSAGASARRAAADHRRPRLPDVPFRLQAGPRLGPRPGAGGPRPTSPGSAASSAPTAPTCSRPTTPSPASTSRCGTSSAVAVGEPVWRLLGVERAEPRLPYASVLFGDEPPGTLAKARAIRAAGLPRRQVRLGPLRPGERRGGRRAGRGGAGGAGPDGVLLVDAGTVWGADVAAARERLPALKAAGAAWLEEPFVGGAVAAYAALAAESAPVALAGGEGRAQPLAGAPPDRPRRDRLRPGRRRPDRRHHPGAAGRRLRRGRGHRLRQPHLHQPPRPLGLAPAVRRPPGRRHLRVPGRAETAGGRGDEAAP